MGTSNRRGPKQSALIGIDSSMNKSLVREIFRANCRAPLYLSYWTHSKISVQQSPIRTLEYRSNISWSIALRRVLRESERRPLMSTIDKDITEVCTLRKGMRPV